MSALDLKAIRLALADRLSTIPDVFVYPQWPGTPQVYPCLVIFPPEDVDYSQTSQRGLDIATWHVQALVGLMSPVAQDLLLGLMSGVGDHSVITCLYGQRRLGGVVSNLRVPGIRSGMFQVTTNTNENVLGCDITVETAA